MGIWAFGYFTTPSLSYSIFCLCTALFSVAAHFKWAASFLLYNSLFQHRHLRIPHEICADEKLGVRKYKPPPGPESGEPVAAAECAVCLCEIEEGEEVKELRCDHVFHSDCLDRWVGYRHYHPTCPLCRKALLEPPQRLVNHLGEEVFVFHEFCSFGSGSERERWWLR